MHEFCELKTTVIIFNLLYHFPKKPNSECETKTQMLFLSLIMDCCAIIGLNVKNIVSQNDTRVISSPVLLQLSTNMTFLSVIGVFFFCSSFVLQFFRCCSCTTQWRNRKSVIVIYFRYFSRRVSVTKTLCFIRTTGSCIRFLPSSDRTLNVYIYQR